MKIYLDNRLLIQSKIIPEKERWNRDNKKSERNWEIYTFNSKNRFTRTKQYYNYNTNIDLDPKNKYNLVKVSLKSYENFSEWAEDDLIQLLFIFEEFEHSNISCPNHKIEISGYDSGILTPFSVIKNLTNILENHGIDCLVSNNAAPLCSHIFYESPKIKNQRENPIEIKLI